MHKLYKKIICLGGVLLLLSGFCLGILPAGSDTEAYAKTYEAENTEEETYETELIETELIETELIETDIIESETFEIESAEIENTEIKDVEPEEFFDLTVLGDDNCQVRVDQNVNQAKAGDYVQFTVTDYENHPVMPLTIRILDDSENRLQWQKLDEITYGFSMPAGNVRILAFSPYTLPMLFSVGDTYTLANHGLMPEYVNPDGSAIQTEYLQAKITGGSFQEAFCVAANYTAPENGIQATCTQESSNVNLRKVLWYGRGGPGAITTSYQITHFAASLAFGLSPYDSAYKLGSQFLARVAVLQEPPVAFHVYILSTNKPGYQYLAVWEYKPEYYGKIVKKFNAFSTAQAEIVAVNPSSSHVSYTADTAKYGVYEDSALTKKVATVSIPESGTAYFKVTNPGTYYVAETKAPPGYLLDPTKYRVVITGTEETKAEAVTITSVEEMARGVIYLRKTFDGKDTYPGKTADGVAYGTVPNLAIMRVYTDPECKQLYTSPHTNHFYFTVTLDDASGHLYGYMYVDPGVYYVKEYKAPEGYQASDKVYKYTVKANQVATAKTDETPLDNQSVGYLKLKKKSANPELTDGNSLYSLKSAKYGVYKTSADAKADKNRVEELVTTSSGSSNTVTLPIGTYYVKEIRASKGFFLDATIYTEKITRLATKTVISIEEPDTPDEPDEPEEPDEPIPVPTGIRLEHSGILFLILALVLFSFRLKFVH